MNLAAQIEPGIRDLVVRLRESGINTECSCHHEWYVQCQSTDPTTELTRVWNVMADMAIREYRVVLTRECTDGHWRQTMEIRFSPTLSMLAKAAEAAEGSER